MTGNFTIVASDQTRLRLVMTNVNISIYYLHLESTELSKAFARQGLKIPIRNDGKLQFARCLCANKESHPFNITYVYSSHQEKH